MRSTTVGIMAAVFAATTVPAQGRFTVDPRVIIAVPTATLAGADLAPGIGIGGALSAPLNDHLSLYGGWDWMSFSADRSFAGDDRQFEETGYTIGIRHDQAFTPIQAGQWFKLRLEIGATYKHIEVEDPNGDIIGSSDHATGFEAALGAVSLKSGRWRFSPTVRYRATPASITLGGTTTEAQLRYLGLEFGLSRAF